MRVKTSIFSRTSECKVVELPDVSDSEEGFIGEDIVGLAVDNNNNTYIVKTRAVRAADTGYPVYSFVLNTLDANYNVKHEGILHFLDVTQPRNGIYIAINKNDKIFMIQGVDGDRHVYQCDNTGQLIQKIEHSSHCLGRLRYLCLSPNSDIITTRDNTVYVFSEQGKLKSTASLPEGHWVSGLAFHKITCKIK